ncbi:RHS repeat-associated core domain-containing protein [Planctellipticum variicoloris]|uniref:RHS repeat-associated core domain-containing protein n=1 Tax=Planctellipticum variicoloris TaxID=3064265 RepID=UPI003AF77A80|nr:RHS repeat-associated core domain-containing protein [Planctomycetaceae bacterium SH412]
MGDITTYSWDYENRLVQVEHPTGEIVTSVYDPDGHRVAQDDGVAAQQFVYDGNNLLQERDDVGTVEADYTYVPQEYARYVSQQRDAESRFYHVSGIQDVTQLTDAGETVTDDYRFDAWGKPLATTGSTENPHTYKGEAGYQSAPQLSAEESTYYLHHRVLPSQGRFLSEDPLDDDANTYRYVRNNPVNAVDPSGLEEVVLQTADGDVLIPESAQTGYIGRLVTLLRDAELTGNTSFATTVRRTLLVAWNERQGLHTEHQLYSAQQKRLNRLSQTFEPIDIIARPLGYAASATAKQVGKTSESVGDQLVWIDGKLVDAAEWAVDRYADARNLSISTGYETRSPEAYRRYQQYLEYNAITHGSDVARELSHRPWDPEYITPNEQAEFDMAVGGTLEVLTGGLGKSGPFAREALKHADDLPWSAKQQAWKFESATDDLATRNAPSSKVTLNVVEGTQTAPAKFVRTLKPGEKIPDLIAEGKSATWVNEAEHAIVSLAGEGKIQRVVVSGGRDGIDFIQKDGKLFFEMDGKLVQVRRVLGHTHPRATGPSQGDLDAMKILGQSRSYIIEIGGEPGGTIIRPK